MLLFLVLVVDWYLQSSNCRTKKKKSFKIEGHWPSSEAKRTWDCFLEEKKICFRDLAQCSIDFGDFWYVLGLWTFCLF